MADIEAKEWFVVEKIRGFCCFHVSAAHPSVDPSYYIRELSLLLTVTFYYPGNIAARIDAGAKSDSATIGQTDSLAYQGTNLRSIGQLYLRPVGVKYAVGSIGAGIYGNCRYAARISQIRPSHGGAVG